jgi:hypothetical protein
MQEPKKNEGPIGRTRNSINLPEYTASVEKRKSHHMPEALRIMFKRDIKVKRR